MAKLLLTCACGLGVASILGVSADAAGGRLRAVVNGALVPAARVAAITVEGDTIGVDVAAIVLEPGRALPAAGEDVIVEAVTGGNAATIFTGEILEVVPGVAADEGVVRAFNRLHRLTRGRKTRTFEKQSDAEIAGTIAREAGLDLFVSNPPAISHEHVYQNNQTDLEFLRVRAGLIGFEVWVDDRTLNFRKRADSPEITLGCAPTLNRRVFLDLFHPKLAGPGAPAAVSVRGLDARTGDELAATATRHLIPLSPTGAEMRSPPGAMIDLGVVPTLQDESAAYGAAVGTLAALTKLDLAGEADSDGSPALRAGVRVSLQHADARFDGAYYVTGVKHRYQKRSEGGYRTSLRLVRSDRGLFVLPEVGDEVLVAFEQGDLSRPFVVGSLWDDDERPPQESPVCDGRRP